MRHKKFRQKRGAEQDYHHILFQKKHYQQGYAKRLREHAYLGAYIPQNALHSALHSKIHDVPTPSGLDCRRAYDELMRRQKAGTIDCVNDTLEQRINFLIEVWQDTCPATVAILTWQRDIVAKFYARHPVAS